MRVLVLDIETAPNLAYVWGLWKQNIGTDWMVEAGYTMCWSAKWLGKKKVYFASVQRHDEHEMLREIHGLLDEADAVVTYNGDKFDLPTLNKEFLLNRLPPPSPYKSIDLYKTARRFRFPSRKLDYIAKSLGLKGKVVHRGRDLWIGCIKGDEKCWREMERYNRRDVTELEKVYKELLPWIYNHPNRALYELRDRPSCATCGSARIHRRGYAHTRNERYAKYQCQSCGAWSRERCTAMSAEERKNILVKAN